MLSYCGKTCASNAKTKNTGSNLGSKPVVKATPQANNASNLCTVSSSVLRIEVRLLILVRMWRTIYCQVCGQRPKHNDGIKTYDYCGKACATKALASALPPLSSLPVNAVPSAAPAPILSIPAPATPAATTTSDLCAVSLVEFISYYH